MIYCDTSFLLAVYFERDRFHLEATKCVVKFKAPIPLTLLVELELHNGVRRLLGAGLLSRQQHDAAFRQIAEDEADGILSRCTLAPAEHYAKARELSKKFTPTLSLRSLDILHVAAALLLKATDLASFDDRQRELAEKAGLKGMPH